MKQNEPSKNEMTDKALFTQVALALAVIGYTLLSALLVAFFLKGNYFTSIHHLVRYIWLTPWTLCFMFAVVSIGLYFLVDGLKALLIRRRSTFNIVKKSVVKNDIKVEDLKKVPVVVMKSSLKNCTSDQAIEALTAHLKELGFIDFEQENLPQNFGVQLIAKSSEGRFAFMIGGLSETLTMDDIEKFATGRAYFDCHDALCISTENATKDAKRRAAELFIPYIDADHYREELQRYFSSIRMKQSVGI